MALKNKVASSSALSAARMATRRWQLYAASSAGAMAA